MSDRECLLRAELARVQAEIDAAYWTFTRCKRGRPVPLALFERKWALKQQLQEEEKLS